jgi:hypothetical protein
MTTATSTIVTETPNPSLQETAAAMGIDPATVTADVNGAVQADPVKPVSEATAKARPDNIPEKFWNAEKGEVNTEALLKSYSELEKKSSTPKADAEGETSAEEAGTSEETKPEPTAEELAKQATDKAGINLEEVSSRYWETGKISDDDYAALEKAGYPKHLVDQFAAGQQAVVEIERQQVFNLTGGEEGYKSMIEWAKSWPGCQRDRCLRQRRQRC